MGGRYELSAGKKDDARRRRSGGRGRASGRGRECALGCRRLRSMMMSSRSSGSTPTPRFGRRGAGGGSSPVRSMTAWGSSGSAGVGSAGGREERLLRGRSGRVGSGRVAGVVVREGRGRGGGLSAVRSMTASSRGRSRTTS